MKNQTFGIEIETTGLGRRGTAQAIAAFFGTTARYIGAHLDNWEVPMPDGRHWTVESDASVTNPSAEVVSPVCRDYLKVGYYTEVVFPGLDIRFIAINNGVDSANQQDSDFTPFLNIINEWYAKDTSKKIRAVFKSKGQSGKPLATNVPYGYRKDPEDKTHWLVDEAAAVIVREVFHLCISGYEPSQIARMLTECRVMNPTAYARSRGVNIPDNREYTDDYTWGTSTITHMLARQEYLDHTVNFKTHRKSYKQKKLLKKDPSQWAVFENTHEAIIDQEAFDIVQQIRDGRRRLMPMGEEPLLSGMLFCADCGKKLYLARTRNNSKAPYYVCSSY